MFNELLENEMMTIDGGRDSITFDGNSGGMPWADWKKDSSGNIDINVYTPVGTVRIHDDTSNNVNYNKSDNSNGKYN